MKPISLIALAAAALLAGPSATLAQGTQDKSILRPTS